MSTKLNVAFSSTLRAQSSAIETFTENWNSMIKNDYLDIIQSVEKLARQKWVLLSFLIYYHFTYFLIL